MNEHEDQQVDFELGQTRSDGRTAIFLRRAGVVLFSDTCQLVSATSRSRFLGRCEAVLPGLPSSELAKLDAQLIQFAERATHERSAAGAPPVRTVAELVAARDNSADAALESMPDEVVADAQRVLADPGLVDIVRADIQALGIVGEQDLTLTIYLVGTSRLLDAPQSAVVQGPSSSGKSIVIEKVATLLPPEAVMHSTDLTKNALYYVEEDALVHRFVVAGERARRKDDEQAEETRAMRELLSSKVLRKTYPDKDESGAFTTKTITRHGPVAYVESTTLTKLFDEDANRCLLLATDESPAQTRRILDHAARQAAGSRPRLDHLLARHHALQRLLRRVHVRVPFAAALVRQMPDGRPEARRGLGHVLSVIRSVALLHQFQRIPRERVLAHGDVIDAALDDYAIARQLLLAPLARLLGQDLTPGIANFGKRIIQQWGSQPFNAAQATDKDPTIKVSEVGRRYLKALEAAGVVEVTEIGRGGKANVYRVVSTVPEPGAAWLPSREELVGALGSDPVLPDAASAGCLVRQLIDGRESAPPGSGSQDFLQPAPAVRLGAPGCRLEPGFSDDVITDGCRTSHTETHPEHRLPADPPLAPVDDGGSGWFGADNQTHQQSHEGDPDPDCSHASVRAVSP